MRWGWERLFCAPFAGFVSLQSLLRRDVVGCRRRWSTPIRGREVKVVKGVGHRAREGRE